MYNIPHRIFALQLELFRCSTDTIDFFEVRMRKFTNLLHNAEEWPVGFDVSEVMGET